MEQNWVSKKGKTRLKVKLIKQGTIENQEEHLTWHHLVPHPHLDWELRGAPDMASFCSRFTPLLDPSPASTSSSGPMPLPMSTHMFTVALHYQIMDYLGLKDSSRKLVASCAISFIISLYLILMEQLLKFRKRNQTGPKYALRLNYNKTIYLENQNHLYNIKLK